MAPIVASIEVHRPAADVFAYATDPSRFLEWQSGVVSGRMDSKASPTIGDRCLTTRRIGFVERPVTAELADYAPPKRWRVRGIDGPIRATVEVTVEPRAADRSNLTISVEFEGRGFGKILVPLVVEREARREMPANLARLKARVEAADPHAPLTAASRTRLLVRLVTGNRVINVVVTFASQLRQLGDGLQP